MGTGDILLRGGGGVTRPWISIPSRGEAQNSYACFILRKPEISSGRVGLWLVYAFTFLRFTFLHTVPFNIFCYNTELRTARRPNFRTVKALPYEFSAGRKFARCRAHARSLTLVTSHQVTLKIITLFSTVRKSFNNNDRD